jgi:hypothetical protein
MQLKVINHSRVVRIQGDLMIRSMSLGALRLQPLVDTVEPS